MCTLNIRFNKVREGEDIKKALDCLYLKLTLNKIGFIVPSQV